MDDPTGTRPTEPTDCESCGDTTAAVALVRRVYLPVDLERPPAHDNPVVGEAVDDAVTTGDLEWWCEVCRIHYPHQVA